VSGVCPHPYRLKVQDRCYSCLKTAALNGHRDRLEPEALAFVGFTREPQEERAFSRESAWLQPVNPSNIDKQLEELARLRDIAPGWYALAKRIVGSETENEK
jgi:hypothetical protein